MRAAPPVQALSCGAGAWRLFQQLLYGLSAAVAAWWVVAHLEGGAAAVAGAVATGLAVAFVCGRRSTEFLLVWDGAGWTLHPPQGEGMSGRPSLMIDLGDWVLVRFMPGAHWLPLSRRDVADWQALRVALHAVALLRPGA